ncbi:TetR family transcriptional regulator [soil metagenome]
MNLSTVPTLSAKRTRNASETRERILDAARLSFSQRGYEHVGVRDISAAAGVDAALINRYFGTKESLFAEVIRGAFHVEDHLPESMNQLGEFLVGQILGEAEDRTPSFNPLRLLLLAASSPETAAIVARQFDAEFVRPLAKRLRGRDAALRATLIASYVIGLATMRHLLEAPELSRTSLRKTSVWTGQAIQACATPPG